MTLLFLKERREPIGKREAEQLLDLKITRGGPEKLRAIQETVSALLGVEIDAFKVSSREDSSAELDVDKFLVQVNGAGIREALRLILDYEFRQPDILLVEEPEIHLHPALEVSMMRYLKKTGSELKYSLLRIRRIFWIRQRCETYISYQRIDLQRCNSSIWPKPKS